MAVKKFSQAREQSPATGIEPQQRTKVAKALAGMLASTYALYRKSLFYHWNVTGEHFFSLHKLFEEEYQELHQAGDEIAERIRALGHFAPGTLSEFTSLSLVKEDAQLPRDWQTMVQNLLKSHEQCSRQARQVLETAQGAEDEVTVDLMIGRMQTHDKSAWMLRSLVTP